MAATVTPALASQVPVAGEPKTVERLIQAFEGAFAVRTDAKACIRETSTVQEQAWTLLPDPRAVDLLNQLFICRLMEQLDGTGDEAERLLALGRQWLAAAQAPNAVAVRACIRSHLWFFLMAHGHEEQGRSELEAFFNAALSAAPSSPAQEQELTLFAEHLYGHNYSVGLLVEINERFVRELGPDARPSLVMARVLAVAYRRLGRQHEAFALIDRAYQAALRQLPPDDVVRAWLDSERGLVLWRLGRTEEAIASQQRMAVFWQQPPHVSALRTLRAQVNLASLHLAEGNLRAAIQASEEAETVARAGRHPLLGFEILPARAVREIARLHQGALDAPARLRAAIQAVGSPAFDMGFALEELLLTAERLGNAELAAWAGRELQTTAAAYSNPLQSDRALWHLVQARQVPEQAVDSRWRALAIASMGRGPAQEALVMFDVAHSQQADRPALAVALNKRAIQALQRSRQQGLPADQQRVSLARFEPYLRGFVSLLLDRGNLKEAEQAMAFLQEEELGEFSRRRGRRDTGLGQPPSMNPAEREWGRQLDLIGQELLTAAQPIEAQIDQQRQLILRDKLDIPEANIALAQASERIAALARTLQHKATSPAPAADEIAVRPDEVALRFFVSDETVEVLVSSAQGRTARKSLPLPRARLARQVQALRQALERADGQALALATQLHEDLLGPLLRELPPVTRLTLLTDDVLRYLPFAALHDGKSYLVERYVLAHRGSRPARSPLRPVPGSGGALGLGSTRSHSSHSALPAVARELAALRGSLGARVLQDQDFTPAALAAALSAPAEQQPALVHLASHFMLDPGGDAHSYLVLGDGQRLSLAELGRLPWQGVQLAVLSACDTALALDGGKGQGRELVGLAATLQGAGVQQVLATQWRVADEASADWISAFYAGLSPRSPLDAGVLAEAQRRWLRTHRDDPRRHPHYWAAYTWFE